MDFQSIADMYDEEKKRKATQGEKPAEARLPVDIIANVLRADSGRTPRGLLAEKAMEALEAAGYVISSPQEGATAVGADKIEALKASLRAAARWYARQSAENHGPAHEDAKPETWDTWQAADIIEALQRQVAEANESRELAWRCQHSQRQDLLARAEAAEASLRTLGDALERARRTLDACAKRFREYEAIHASKTANPEPLKVKRNAEMAELCESTLAALTPPTRDTSCEALGEERDAQDRAEMTSPSDKGADE